jgi:hypothetical protein
MMTQEIKTWLCRKCDSEKPVGKFRIRYGRLGQLRIDNICKSCRGRAEYSRLKLEMLEVFGWKCSCCGEDHPQFLSLEHIHGVAPYFLGPRRNKAASRKQTSTYQLYRMAKRDGWDRTKYECLCMNCNFADGHYGACPHRSGITRDQVIQSLRRATVGIGTGFRKGIGGEATRYKVGVPRPDLIGNKFHESIPRGAHGRFSKSDVSEELKRIEKASG